MSLNNVVHHITFLSKFLKPIHSLIFLKLPVNPASVSQINIKKCNPSKIEILGEEYPKSQGSSQGLLTPNTVINLLTLQTQSQNLKPNDCNQSSSILSLNIESFSKVSNASFRCIDGRVRKTGFSSLGGDAGEFLLALAVYENSIPKMEPITQEKKKFFTKEKIKIYFESYLRWMKSDTFYFCTDRQSISVIETEVESEDFSLEDVKPNLRNKVLEKVILPENQGSKYLKILMSKIF